MNDTNQKWLVFYHRGARFASLPLTSTNLDGMRADCYMHLIQEDVTGTQHWSIDSVKRKSRMHDRRRRVGTTGMVAA